MMKSSELPLEYQRRGMPRQPDPLGARRRIDRDVVRAAIHAEQRVQDVLDMAPGITTRATPASKSDCKT